MLTIIIASASVQLKEAVKANIKKTAGCPYEVLIFDNSDGKKSICEIYNEGAQKAGFELLCFMHEDVEFKTAGWGNIVAEQFSMNSRLGVLGIAGSIYKSLTPSGWATHSHAVKTEHINLIQSYKYISSPAVQTCLNPSNQNPAKVAIVDGVWMCTRKEIVTRFPFDEQLFKKFHCYDVDFCISVGRFYDVAVTYDVLLHHYSEGLFNKEWMKEVLKLHKKWSSFLPVYTKAFTPKQIYQVEKQSFRFFIKQLVLLGFSAKVAYKVLWQHNSFAKLNLNLFAKLNYDVFKCFVIKKGKG